MTLPRASFHDWHSQDNTRQVEVTPNLHEKSGLNAVLAMAHNEQFTQHVQKHDAMVDQIPRKPCTVQPGCYTNDSTKMGRESASAIPLTFCIRQETRRSSTRRRLSFQQRQPTRSNDPCETTAAARRQAINGSSCRTECAKTTHAGEGGQPLFRFRHIRRRFIWRNPKCGTGGEKRQRCCSETYRMLGRITVSRLESCSNPPRC